MRHCHPDNLRIHSTNKKKKTRSKDNDSSKGNKADVDVTLGDRHRYATFKFSFSFAYHSNVAHQLCITDHYRPFPFLFVGCRYRFLRLVVHFFICVCLPAPVRLSMSVCLYVLCCCRRTVSWPRNKQRAMVWLFLYFV